MRTDDEPAGGGAGMLMEVTCQCGWSCRGTEDEVVAQIQDHGRSAHGVEVSRDDVLAEMRPVGPSVAEGA
jgi:predicted small metal-binding protein